MKPSFPESKNRKSSFFVLTSGISKRNHNKDNRVSFSLFGCFWDFRQGVEELVTKIINEVEPKSIEHRKLTPKMFLDFALESVEAFNSESRLYVDSTAERVILSQIRKIFDQSFAKGARRIEEQINTETMPLEVETFRGICEGASRESIKYFQLKVKDYIAPMEMIKYGDDLREKLEQECLIKEKLNEKMSESLCDENLGYIVVNFETPFIKDVASLRESLCRELKQKFIEFLYEYVKNSRGPSKFLKGFDLVPGFLFDFFEKLIKQLKLLYEDELKMVNSYLQESRQGEENLRRFVERNEKLMIEIRKESEHFKRESEKTEREFRRFKTIKEKEEAANQALIDELQSKFSKKHDQVRILKKDLAQKTIDLKKKLAEIDEKNKSIALLNHTVSEQKIQIRELERLKMDSKDPGLSGKAVKEVERILEFVEEVKSILKNEAVAERLEQLQEKLGLKDAEIIQIKKNMHSELSEHKETLKRMSAEMNQRKKEISDHQTRRLNDVQRSNERLKEEKLKMEQTMLKTNTDYNRLLNDNKVHKQIDERDGDCLGRCG